MKSIVLKAPDGKDIHLYTQLSGNTPKAIVLIVHGMAEHAARYEDFALFLNKNEIDVYAPDLRGHGKTSGSIEKTGHFADKNGWEVVVEDIHLVVTTITQNNPGIPLILFGHSLGSLLSRSYFEKYGQTIQILILSGSSYQPKSLLYGGILICWLQKVFFGVRHRSSLLTIMSFGNFNKNFKPAQTEFDWLSRNTESNAKYVADENCGFTCTVGFFNDMLKGILSIQTKNHFKNIPKDKPVYMFSGTDDPVGNFGKGIGKIFHLYEKAGIKNIELKLFTGGRHEMLNEINREEVFLDVLKFIETKNDIN